MTIIAEWKPSWYVQEETPAIELNVTLDYEDDLEWSPQEEYVEQTYCFDTWQKFLVVGAEDILKAERIHIR